MMGITTRRVEEHKIRRRIVQEAGKDARQPEIHGVDRLAVVRDKPDKRRKRPVRTSAQDGYGRNHADEDAEKELGHFLNGAPGKAVHFTATPAGKVQGKPGHAQQRQVAQKVLPLHRHAEHINQHAQRIQPGKQHRNNNAEQEHKIDFAFKTKFFLLHARLRRRRRAAFLAEQHRIKGKEDAQQNSRQQTGFCKQVCSGPEKVHAFQKTEEQRRIAQRRERTADIGHKKDEKNH